MVAETTYVEGGGMQMNPKFPVWVPTKGRWRTPMTIKMFDKLRVPHRVVVQPQERRYYAAVVGQHGKIVTLPDGLDGLVPTRNWIWDQSAKEGVERFWTFDDNIRAIYRRHQNTDWMMQDGTALKVIEDWAGRWTNLAITGMQYFMFSPRRVDLPALTLNTRVYSNMLVLTDAKDAFGKPYRNRGVYNDDTDLCLQVLTDGWCTALFYAFLVWKMTTMKVAGGNTPIYQKDGRLNMSLELQKRWPRLVKTKWKWGRWQHSVDYRPFRKNRLLPKPGLVVKRGADNYGMELGKVGCNERHSTSMFRR